MFHRFAVIAMACCCLVGSLGAQTLGSASGRGTIDLISASASGGSELVAFSPRYSYAYSEGTGAKRFTWIVLTDKEPPVAAWASAKDRAEVRRVWCEKEKASFVAVKLDAAWNVDLYFLCPANGAVSTEMLSTWNGLDSVAVRFEVRDEKRLKGTVRTGSGSCPGADGSQTYCTPTGDYSFDASLSR
ncbi:MAG TPA: hypothetical protein VN380_06660 [Thermoanaerobaculia bacterium]|jgi:hypothetical protein|nr:hypothetical protein [Thermoanaerobaculia bacterium]